MTQDKKKWNKYLIDKKINYKGNKEYEDFVIKTNAKKLHQIVTKTGQSVWFRCPKPWIIIDFPTESSD